jgi:hypothetical protein
MEDTVTETTTTKTIKEKLSFNMDPEILDKPARTIEKAIMKSGTNIAEGLILGGLVIGFAILMTSC